MKCIIYFTLLVFICIVCNTLGANALTMDNLMYITSQFTGQPDWIRSTNWTGESPLFDNLTVSGNISSDYFKGNMDWTNLTNYPVACPGSPTDSVLTALGDSVTCTNFHSLLNNNRTGGDVTFGDNINVGGANYITIDYDKIHFNAGVVGTPYFEYIGGATDSLTLTGGTNFDKFIIDTDNINLSGNTIVEGTLGVSGDLTATQLYGNGSHLEEIDLERDLVLWMPFQAGSQTRDHSSKGNDGTVTGAVYNGSGGYDGFGAYEFDGDKDSIGITDHASLDITDAITMSAWVKYTSDADHYIISKGADMYGLLTYNADNGKISFIFSGDSGDLETPSAYNDGVWHHVVGTYDKDAGSDNRKIYVDGVEVASDTETNAMGQDNNKLAIGGYHDGRYSWSGTIDEVLIFNRSLSAEEIKRLYEKRRAEPSFRDNVTLGETLKFSDTEYISSKNTNELSFHFNNTDIGAKFYSGINEMLNIRRYSVSAQTHTELVFPAGLDFVKTPDQAVMQIRTDRINALQDIRLPDNTGIYLGNAVDSVFAFNGSDPVLYTKNVGVGKFWIYGDVIIKESLDVVENITGNQIYGEMWYHNHTGTELNFAVDGLFYNLTMDMSDVNGFTFNDAGEYLETQVAGKYKACYMGSGSGQNNHIYFTTVLINGVEQDKCGSHKKMTAGGDIVTMNGCCFIDLSIDDYVQVGTADVGATGTGNYYSSNLNLVRIGD